MKKSIYFIGIILVIFLAIGVPKFLDNGLENLKNPEEKQAATYYVEEARNMLFNPIDKLMTKGYKITDISLKKSQEDEKCYKVTIQYYTFFGIPYKGVEADCEGNAVID